MKESKETEEIFSADESSEEEDEEAVSEKPSSDMHGVIGNALKKIPFKLLGFIFIIYIMLSNDIFINRMLNKFDGAVGYNSLPTTYGTVIIGVLLILLVTPIYVLIENKTI